MSITATLPPSAGSSPRPWGTPRCKGVLQCRVRFIPTPVGNTCLPQHPQANLAVHPHARGEHEMPRLSLVQTNGSSPRPWGTRGVGPVDRDHSRFIPTPVGNTPSLARRPTHSPVHPHARGEHRRSRCFARPAVGSSPRPWGTQWVSPLRCAVNRFIPTPVGNTVESDKGATADTVHPHARGEHQDRLQPGAMARGSSPRPWGTPQSRYAGRAPHRFIPTPVGNTAHRRTERRCLSVHPHARGEHACSKIRAEGVGGSSPRPWGTRGLEPRHLAARRFIPTPVGNTRCADARADWSPVHPHARGEHVRSPHHSRALRGSSPRPWGTRPGEHGRHDDQRFIPTPVGNTPDIYGKNALQLVHPHARGEHSFRFARRVSRAGSSPRPWGTLHRAKADGERFRFIPTPVGNTCVR